MHAEHTALTDASRRPVRAQKARVPDGVQYIRAIDGLGGRYGAERRPRR
jgi:hypothetical protein